MCNVSQFTLEIHLTYKCNLRCPNCRALVGVAPAPHLDMTTDILSNMLVESVRESYPWKYFMLYGGEPAMHPDFYNLCRILAEYRDQNNPGLGIGCLSNGGSAPKLARIFADFNIGAGISEKSGDGLNKNGDMMPYDRTMESPIDIGRAPVFGCWMPGQCGIAFNVTGFYPCSSAASQSRVFNTVPMARHVAELSNMNYKEAFVHYCRHCGDGQPDHIERRSYEQVISPIWQKALELYNNHTDMGATI